MDQEIKILHLSDLHLDVSSFRDQKVVLQALFKDVASEVEKNGPIDLVFFTGDLIAKGAYTTGNIELVQTDFLAPLMQAAAIGPNQLFLVPGNHDVCQKEKSSIVASAQKDLNSEEKIAKYLEDVFKQQEGTGLEGFNGIIKKINNTDLSFSNNHYAAYTSIVKELKIGIAALNSAWCATGAPSDGDYGKLKVGRRQMDEVVGVLHDADVRIVLSPTQI